MIDSGIDVKHPELANSIADSFDALGSKEGPHVHGTGVAGAIAAHARLMGSAPAARILAIRAFGKASGGAESTSFVILKGMDYAAAHGAQIVNMSFAGPKDALIERGIAALAAKGIVMVAAAGNAGAKSPPLYPAANANVIAVSATDAQDKLFTASNRGGYIAVAAPGVDVFLPAPDEKYQITSGTSFSAAYVSGLAALMLERNPALKPEEAARDPDENRPRSRFPRPRRSVRRRRSRCLCRGLGRRRRAGRRDIRAARRRDRKMFRTGSKFRPPGRWTGRRPPWPPTSPPRATLIAPPRNNFHPEKRPPKS